MNRGDASEFQDAYPRGGLEKSLKSVRAGEREGLA
jgi:hypothetical protein